MSAACGVRISDGGRQSGVELCVVTMVGLVVPLAFRRVKASHDLYQ